MEATVTTKKAKQAAAQKAATTGKPVPKKKTSKGK
jgi:hypothetical protein